jgi:HEPN superfamily Apea-like protein
MDLVDRLGSEVVQPLMPKPNRWARAATDARNVLVHRFDVDQPDEPITGPVMYALAELTSSVITLLLLQEIGLSASKLTGLAEHHQSFQWVWEEASKDVPDVFGIRA